MDTITTPQGKKFAYTYNKGQLQSLMYPNGISAKYTFDNNGNLEDLHYQRSDMSTVQRYRYAYDRNNMRTSMSDNDGVHDYSYDSLYQIIGATHPTVANPLEQFSYDAVGNRLGMERVHNELNQLTEDDSCWYSYDADGNMAEKVSKSTNDTMYFVWDIENKLTEVRKPGMVAQYTYDALGRRMSKDVNGVRTQFRYDGDDLIVEMDSNDSITASYTFGPGIDNPLMMHRNNQNYYYLKDGLRSVTALIDSTANVVKEYQYSVFGETMKETGLGVLNLFAYTGRERDEETGNYYYRARYYSPQIGRFLSTDPLGFGAGDCNLYRFVGNSPAGFSDPHGMSTGDQLGITSSFLEHYFGGTGLTYSLQGGELDLFKSNTTKQSNSLKEMVRDAVSKAASAGATNANGTRRSAYNLILDIFVLGNGSLFMDYSCDITYNTKDCKTTGYTSICILTIHFKDWFRDPLDTFNWLKPDVEVPPGVPYPITGSWSETLKETVVY